MSARGLLRLRGRGLSRALRQSPGRALGWALLAGLSLVGLAWLLFDLYAEIQRAIPGPDARAVAPPGCDTAYITWREVSFWGLLLLWMPSCYRSMRDLFHRPEWTAYATLPLRPEDIYLEAALLAAGFGAAWLPVGLLFALPPLWAGDAAGGAAVALHAVCTWIAVSLAAPGIHAAAARAATSPGSQSVLGPLSGGWVSADAAPFLYAPAAVLMGLGLGGIALQRGIESLVFSTGGGALPGVGGALGLSLALFVLGRGWYGASFLRALPLLREAERSLSEGQALARELPYGVSVASLLPGAARPWLSLSLLALSRGGRARWLQLVLLLLAGVLFLWRAVQVPAWFPVASAAAVCWVASAGVWLSEEASTPRWLRMTLPVPGASVALGWGGAASFFALHLGLPLGGLLVWGGDASGWWVIATAPAAGLLAGALPAALRGGGAIWLYALCCGGALAAGRLGLGLAPLLLGGVAAVVLLLARAQPARV